MAVRQAFRLFRAARVLATYDALVPREYAKDMPWSARAFARVVKLFTFKGKVGGRPGQRLAAALESLGPSYVKLGQFLATRRDIIGTDIARDLEQLQDRLPPFSIAEAIAAVETEFGERLPDLFDSFAPPIAAASIAQVHPATIVITKSPSDEGASPELQRMNVAVKILRPGIESRFAADLSAFSFAARMAERLGGAEAERLRPTAVVDTLAKSVALEMDLRFEAAAASELAETMQGDPDFRIPQVIWERTSRRVLTTEWVDGISIRDREGLIAAGHDLNRLATLVIQSFLRQALGFGFFHADLHPGNLFVDPQSRLVAVDFGIMGRLDATMRRFMAETLYGFLTRDYARVAQVHFDVGFVPKTHALEDFAQALRSVGEPVFGRTSDQISMARLLAQLFEITRIFDMQLQPQLVLLQKTMVVVEGVARDLDPTVNIWEVSRPVIERWMTDRLGPEARLRDAADGVATLGRVLANLPQAAKNLETLAQMATDGGLRLHPETTKAIASTEAQANRAVRIAVWIGASALALLALGQL
jgi:ubiquinone biosynthesis protein